MPIGQVIGRTANFQHIFDFVEQINRFAAITIQLVDKGENRRVAQAADFHQLDGALFNALGAVNHHQRRIHRRQGAVGVLGEILVTGGVEQVDDVIAVGELHHRRGDGDAALLFQLHPVAGGMASGLAALDRAGQLDRAAEQQQLFGEGGLAGVRVGNDGEGAPPLEGVKESGHTEMNIGINVTNKEIQGVKYLQPARAMLQHFAEHRGMSNAYLNGDASFREKIMSKRAQLDEDTKALAAIHAQYGEQLDASGQWRVIKTDWQSLATDGFNLSAKESFTRHTALIKKLLDLITHVGITSNLILDPQADSYFLMEAIVNRLPVMVEDMGQLRGLSAGIVARREITNSEKMYLSKLIARSQIMQEGIHDGLELAFEHNQNLRPALSHQYEAVVTLAGEFLNLMDQRIVGSERLDSALTASEVFAVGTRAIEAGFALYDTAAPKLLELLQLRIADLDRKKYTTIGIVLVCVLLALSFAFGFVRVIIRSLQQAKTVAATIAAGELNHVIAR
jgi:methyl-accepting chemotaxis protein